jgi:hypothetical protein
MRTDIENKILSELLAEIKDGSLQNILRRVIFSGENVIKVMSQERPDEEEKLRLFNETWSLFNEIYETEEEDGEEYMDTDIIDTYICESYWYSGKYNYDDVFRLMSQEDLVNLRKINSYLKEVVKKINYICQERRS